MGPMKMNMIKCITILSVLLYAVVDGSSTCGRKNQESLFRRHGMYVSSVTGITRRTFFVQNFTMEDGEVEAQMFYFHSKILLLPGSTQYSRRWNEGVIRYHHFYSGDDVIFHQISPADGRHIATKLGVGANQFFVELLQGYWYAFEFIDVNPQTHVLLGVTSFLNRGVTMKVEWGNREGMISNFPQHALLITKLTP